MTTHDRRTDEDGFTLVEVLVTVLILGLLAAVVFPVVIPQIDKADPTVVSNDLANIRSGMELFQLDVRPKDPGDIEDLVNQPSGSDNEVNGVSFDGTEDFEGPYVDVTAREGEVTATSTVASTGFGGSVVNGFGLFDSGDTDPTTAHEATSSTADFISVKIVGLSSSDFAEVNDQIDGEDEADADDEADGRLRFAHDTTFYLAVPFRN